MSLIDRFNGYKKTYATDYNDNNKCPYDKTVDKNYDKQSELIKLSQLTNNTISDSYSYAVFNSSKDRDYDIDDKNLYEIADFEKEDKDEMIYGIKPVDYESKDDNFGFNF